MINYQCNQILHRLRKDITHTCTPSLTHTILPNIDTILKTTPASHWQVKDMGLKEADESKLLSRLEKLGRDVSALRFL